MVGEYSVIVYKKFMSSMSESTLKKSLMSLLMNWTTIARQHYYRL